MRTNWCASLDRAATKKRGASPISLRPRESAATPGGASEKNQPLNQKIGEQNQKAGGPERVLQP